jgi:acyl dehydratase
MSRRAWPPSVFHADLEKIREYSTVLGETDPIHHHTAAARARGFADVVAPPMFVAVYCEGPLDRAIDDTGLRDPGAATIHAGQEFRWAAPVIAGDTLTTATELATVEEKGALTFYVFEHATTNQRGEEVSAGRWTIMLRRPDQRSSIPIVSDTA